jgi:hypothetical protein
MQVNDAETRCDTREVIAFLPVLAVCDLPLKKNIFFC